MSDAQREQRETDAAAAEAAAIGGTPSEAPDPTIDEAQRPLAEAGQGEAEGFEQAEAELIDHASHGDQHAARHVVEEAGGEDEDARASGGGEADREYSSARDDDR
jgi:hypothetical protein